MNKDKEPYAVYTKIYEGIKLGDVFAIIGWRLECIKGHVERHEFLSPIEIKEYKDSLS